MKNYILYKGVLLAKNSESFRLLEDKEFDKLKKHQKRLNEEAKKRGDWYEGN